MEDMLTIFIDPKRAEIGIVRWVRDSKFSTIHYPIPPLKKSSMEDFRVSGFVWIHNHFAEFRSRSIEERDVKPVFNGEEARKYLKGKLVVKLSNDKPNTITINPLGFRKYDLGGFKDLGPEKRRHIPLDSPAELFWKTFDEALADA
jgi:hypothetical protein